MSYRRFCIEETCIKSKLKDQFKLMHEIESCIDNNCSREVSEDYIQVVEDRIEELQNQLNELYRLN